MPRGSSSRLYKCALRAGDIGHLATLQAEAAPLARILLCAGLRRFLS